MIDGPAEVSDLDQTGANKALMQHYMDDLRAGRRETFPATSTVPNTFSIIHGSPILSLV